MEPSWLAGCVLAASGLVLVPFALAVVRWRMPRRKVFFARWGFSHLLLVLASFFLVVPIAGSSFPEGVVGSVTATAVSMGLLALMAASFAHRLHPEGIAALGIQGRESGPAFVLGALAFLICLPVFQGLEWVWPPLAELLQVTAGRQPVLDELLALTGAERVGVFAIAILVAPFFEEVLFRGFLQPLLVQNFRELGGIVLTAFLFAILHGTDAFLQLFALSLLLGWLQVQTHRIAAPFGAHALNNALTLFLVQP